jgi:hypothetical protein
MSLSFCFNNSCDQCGRPTMRALIDRHPTDRHLAVQKLHCAHCGPIKTEILSLKPRKRPDVAMTNPIQIAATQWSRLCGRKMS